MRECVRNLTEARYAKSKLFQCLSKVVSGVSTPNLDKCMMPIRDIPWNFAKNVCQRRCRRAPYEKGQVSRSHNRSLTPYFFKKADLSATSSGESTPAAILQRRSRSNAVTTDGERAISTQACSRVSCTGQSVIEGEGAIARYIVLG